jgi:PAS domain S-box-containing protein
MGEKFIVLCCENLKPEVDAVLASEEMPDAEAVAFPFHCGHVRSVWDTIKDQFGQHAKAGNAICLCGCGCANTMDIPRDVKDSPSLVLIGSGASFFLPETLVEDFRKRGSYLILPGWLLRWRQNAASDRLDSSTARQMFGESLTGIVLLDTGVHAGTGPALAEFSDFTGLPARTLPVGLAHFRILLNAEYRKWQIVQERRSCASTLRQAEKRVADYSMVADLTGRLIGIHDEKTVIHHVLDLIVTLCSPKSVGFLPATNRRSGEILSIPPQAYPSPAHFGQKRDPSQLYFLNEDGESYLFSVESNGNLIGTLSVDHVSIPEARDEYINLTHFISQIAGLAITIARTHTDLNLAMKAREMEIAERIRAELALRESEENYRSIIENMQDIFYRTDLDGTITMVSPNGIRIGGYDSPESLVGKNVSAIYADPAERDQFIAALKQKGSVYAYPLRLKDRLGMTRHVTSSSHFYKDARGTIRGIEGVIHDVTARVNAEQALQKSEQKFRSLVETTNDFIWEIDETGAYTYASPQVRGMLGYSPEEVISRTPFEFMPKDEVERVHAIFDPYMAGHLPFSGIENRNLRKDGEGVVLETSGVPVFTKDGVFTGYRGIDRDVTERKRAEEALQQSEERYRGIIENLQDVYFRVDRENCIAMASPSATTMFRVPSAHDIVGKPVTTLWKDPARREELLAALRAGGGDVHDWETEFVRSDGSAFWVSISARLRLDTSGDYDGTEGILRDISERKKIEDALKGAVRKLNMLSSITRHDILNQIMGLRTYLELSMDDLKGTKFEEFVKKEDQAAEAIQRQIEFTKYYQDIGVNAPGWQDAGEVIREAAAQLNPPGVEIEAGIRDIEIFADPLIIKVFFNLMENSVRHGERVTEMSFTSREDAAGLVITYRDNGVGIPAGDKTKLFQKGFGKHTGLGLFLSREILAITGITITENGEPGTGVQFEITVPKGGYRRTG